MNEQRGGQGSIMRILSIGVTVLLVLYLLYAGYFYANQRAILFPRHFIPPSGPQPTLPGLEQIWLATSEGQVEMWYLAPLSNALAGEGTRPAPLLILAHGNGDVIDNWVVPTRPLRERGFGVLLVEYPGYGRAQGNPSYAAIRETILLAYDTIIQHPQVDPARIVLFGHSVGGGAVSVLAAERPSAGMILLSTFTSIRALASDRWLPGLAVRDPFDNLATIRSYPHPTLIIHGTRDGTIPYHHGVALHAAAQQGQLVALECGHGGCIGDWATFWQQLRPFFERAGIVN